MAITSAIIRNGAVGFIEELVFLIGVCQRSRIGTEQILQWPNRTPFTPVVN